MVEFSYPPPRRADPSADESELLQFLNAIERESLTVEQNVKEPWESNLAWYRGQQWMMRNRAPLFMANKIGQIGRKKQAKLVGQKPQMMVQARRQGLPTTSAVLQKTIDAGWDEYHMQMVLEDMAAHLFVYGVSFLGVVWDNSADGGRGDIVPVCIDPRYVHIDPAIQRSHDLDRGSYVWVKSYMPTWEIQQRWPARGQLVGITSANDATGALDKFLNKMFGAWKSGKEPLEEAIPRSPIREYWFHDPTTGSDGMPLYPGGRHVIRGGEDVILTDEPNPYHDERWPIIMIDGIADPEHPWGQSDVQSLRRIQDAINRIGHLFVENTVLTANTWVTIDQGALTPTTMQRLRNISAVVLEKMRGREVTREAPPQMPAHMMEFIIRGLQLMDELSGLSDATAQAQGRVEVRSSEQLEGLQDATEVLIRAMARRVESGLERLGQRWIARIFQFYTRNRILSFLGPTDEWQTFEFERDKLMREIDQAMDAEANELLHRGEVTTTYEELIKQLTADATREAWRHFHYRITPGSSLSSVRAERAKRNMALAERGFISRKHALRDLGFANPEQEIDEAAKESLALAVGAQAAQGAQGASQTPEPSLRRAV